MHDDAATAVKAAPEPKQRARKPRKVLAGPRRLWRWSLRGLAAISVYGAVVAHSIPEIGTVSWQWPTRAEILARLGLDRPPPSPPLAWQAVAKPGDKLDIKGLPVAYWGKPDAAYGERVTRVAKAPVAIIVHFTDETPAVTLVDYGHRGDPARGGSAYGYHFYIDEAGRILQGAPLSVRTNHIKRANAAERTGVAAHLDGANTIGVSLIGACRSPPLSPVTYRCTSETPSGSQIESGLAIIAALQKQFAIPCRAVFGHGELQNDRKSFEGATLSNRARARC